MRYEVSSAKWSCGIPRPSVGVWVVVGVGELMLCDQVGFELCVGGVVWRWPMCSLLNCACASVVPVLLDR